MRLRIKKKQQKEARRFAEYMVGGGAQFWSGYGAYALLDIGFHVPFWPARVLSYAFGASVNFVLQRFWVFGAKRVSRRQVEVSAQKFYALMFANFLIDLGIVGGLRELGVTPYIGQFISAGFFTVWNYLLFKLWVFAKARRSARAKPAPRRSRTYVALHSAPHPATVPKSRLGGVRK